MSFSNKPNNFCSCNLIIFTCFKCFSFLVKVYFKFYYKKNKKYKDVERVITKFLENGSFQEITI